MADTAKLHDDYMLLGNVMIAMRQCHFSLMVLLCMLLDRIRTPESTVEKAKFSPRFF